MSNTPGTVTVTLTDRQIRLLWEALTAVDIDSLNDNLIAFGQPVVTYDERDELDQTLDSHGTFAAEWATVE